MPAHGVVGVSRRFFGGTRRAQMLMEEALSRPKATRPLVWAHMPDEDVEGHLAALRAAEDERRKECERVRQRLPWLDG